jgi:DNA-binding transcriptional LysR family regulator
MASAFDLDLNDIALFVQVVRSGSFAQAARRLGMPSNTVSRRVLQLEARLGTRLLQRSTRKLTLTGAGQAFHEECAASVDGLYEAGQQLMTGSREPSGLVRVAAMADFFDFFPMEWVAEFLATHPRVQIQFVLSDAPADLIGEQIDIAFRGGPLVDSTYVGRQLLSVRSDGMVASPAYIAARGMPSTLQDRGPIWRPGKLAIHRPRRDRRRRAGHGPLHGRHRAGLAQGHAGGARHRAAPAQHGRAGHASRLARAGAAAVPAQGPRTERALPQPAATALGGFGVHRTGHGEARHRRGVAGRASIRPKMTASSSALCRRQQRRRI